MALRRLWSGSGWLHAKLALVAVLLGYHAWCAQVIKTFREDRNQRSHRFYRVANEVPALILIAILILVVVKPI